MKLDDIAVLIRRARLARGLSYRELADLCEGDTTASTIHRLEHDKAINSDTLIDVLNALHLVWVPACDHEYVCRYCGKDADTTDAAPLSQQGLSNKS